MFACALYLEEITENHSLFISFFKNCEFFFFGKYYIVNLLRVKSYGFSCWVLSEVFGSFRDCCTHIRTQLSHLFCYISVSMWRRKYLLIGMLVWMFCVNIWMILHWAVIGDWSNWRNRFDRLNFRVISCGLVFIIHLNVTSFVILTLSCALTYACKLCWECFTAWYFWWNSVNA